MPARQPDLTVVLQPESQYTFISRGSLDPLLRSQPAVFALRDAMVEARNLLEMVAFWAEEAPENVAILGSDRTQWTFQDVAAEANRVACPLLDKASHSPRPVVLLAPNRPETLVGFLAASAVAPCFPLNPRESPAKVRLLLDDLEPEAILLPRDARTEWCDLAAERGIRSIPLPSLPRSEELLPLKGSLACQDDVGLILYTSGTTGNPKQVPLTHGNLLASASHIAETLRLNPQDRGVLVMPVFHIHGLVAGVLSAWRAGGSILCHPGYDEALFFSALAEANATWYSAVPTIHQAVLEAAGRHPEAVEKHRLRFIRSSSSSLDPSLLRELEDCFQVPVIEAYGMTEAAHQIASNPLPPGRRKPGFVGQAAGPELALLTEAGISRKPGSRGEVVVRGRNVMDGYALSREKDAADPNENAFKDGWFRTGDQGALDEEGYLFLTGRIKEMICRGGENIWPREVDESLLSHPGVLHAVAFGVPHPTLGEDLVAAVVAKKDFELGEASLRSHCMKHLAPHQVPSQVVFLESLPKGPSGKPQRIGLADKVGHLLAPEVSTPRQGTETALAEIWKDVLCVERVGREDHFFRLGGDSLSALRTVTAIETRFQVALSQDAVFLSPRLMDLSRQIDDSLGNRTKQATIQDSWPSLLREPRGEEPAPLSTAQEGLWLLTQWLPKAPVHNRATGLRFTGPLDVEMLRDSLEALVHRHEVLRSVVFLRAGIPYQRPCPPYKPVVEWIRGPVDADSFLSHGRVRQVLEEPFHLDTGVSFRTLGLQVSEEEFLLVLVMPHLFCDAWTESILAADLAQAYENLQKTGSPSLSPPAAQCREYARWERLLLPHKGGTGSGPRWHESLKDGSLFPSLFDARGRSAPPSGRGDSVEREIPAELWNAAQELAGRNGLTPFVFFLSAFLALIHRRTGSQDLCVGCLASQRTHPVLRDTAGFLVDTLPVRVNALGSTAFKDFMATVGNNWMECRRERPLPRAWRSSTLFTFEKVPRVPSSMADVQLELFPVDPGGAAQDLSIELRPRGAKGGGGGAAKMTFSTDLAERPYVETIADQYIRLIASATADPSLVLNKLCLLSDAERRRIVFDWNETASPYPKDRCLHQLFQETCLRIPTKIAVSEGTRKRTFQALDADSNRLSLLLRERGVGPGCLVAVMGGRSLEAVTAFLAVLKAGGAYLPLDPLQPEPRIRSMLEQAEASHLLASKKTSPSLPPGLLSPIGLEDALRLAETLPDAPPPLVNRPSDPAYVMFTSGSTGRPKGALIEHKSVVNLCFDPAHKLGGPNPVVLLLSSLGFDGSTLELWLPLLQGGTCAVLTQSRPDLGVLRRRLQEEGVTHLYLPTALFNEVAETCPEILREVHTLWIGGEAQSPGHIRLAQKHLPETQLINLYGTTECTVDSCTYPIMETFPENASTVPIGRPISNTQVYLLDEQGQPVPPGVAGEIYVGGDGLGRGYVSDPAQSQQRFVSNPIPGTPSRRLYRTGDLGRYRMNGEIEFLGRTDDQIKIRGFRVELGEVEEAVKEHEKVRDAKVRAYTDTQSGSGLACYFLSLSQDDIPTRDQLNRFLKARLPEYMVPFWFVHLPEWPKNLHGKIDLNALPPPPEPSLPRTQTAWTPRTELEAFLAEQWRALLDREVAGPDDDFFELGGHSILAMKLLARVASEWHVELPIRAVFERPTLAELAKTIGEAIAADK